MGPFNQSPIYIGPLQTNTINPTLMASVYIKFIKYKLDAISMGPLQTKCCIHESIKTKPIDTGPLPTKCHKYESLTSKVSHIWVP